MAKKRIEYKIYATVQFILADEAAGDPTIDMPGESEEQAMEEARRLAKMAMATGLFYRDPENKSVETLYSPFVIDKVVITRLEEPREISGISDLGLEEAEEEEEEPPTVTAKPVPPKQSKKGPCGFPH